MLGFDARDDCRKLALGERGKPTAVATELCTRREGGGGVMTLRTVDRVVIPPAGLALEKCAPLFLKLLRGGVGRKLLIKSGNLSLEVAVFFLKFRQFLFEQNKLVLQERVALFKDDGRTMLGNEALDLAEDGDAHCEKPNVK